MGAKGHVQVIVPFLTESYTSQVRMLLRVRKRVKRSAKSDDVTIYFFQRDPVDEDVPFCTLKSFPAQIEHCIQWARDKFESAFAQKPIMFNKFWSENTPIDRALQACTIERVYVCCLTSLIVVLVL